MSGRMTRIVNFLAENKDTWYKAFDEADHQENPIQELKLKFRENSSADHFMYAYKVDSIVGGVISIATYLTSSSGFFVLKNVKKLYVYVPDFDDEIIEIEVIYK